MTDINTTTDLPAPEKRFRILQAAKWYSPEVGGIETVALAITAAVKDKAEMKILVCSGKKDKKEEYTPEGVYIYRARTPFCFFSMPVSFDYIRAFRKMSADVDLIQLHAPFPLSDLALFLRKRKRKIKKVIWWHSDVVKQKKLMFFYAPLLKWMLKKVDKIYVASQSIAEQSRYLGKYQDKIEIIPFGISSADYNKVKTAPVLTQKLSKKDRVKILFVGRLVYYKGVDVLLEALYKTQNTELFIIGGGELEGQLKKRAAELKISDRVHFMGKIGKKKLLNSFSDCDIFVLPSVSRAECFGLVQLEAMVYGKPVINTKLPTAVPEVSVDGETGITVEPGNADELANAIQKLTDDKELREQYGKAARQRCEECYSLDKMQEKLYNSYLSVLGLEDSQAEN